MRTIWKYPLKVTDHQGIKLPRGASLLHVATQDDAPFLWAEVRPENATYEQPICIYGTGHSMPDNPGKYLGTFMMGDGALVFHAYAIPAL